MLNGLALSDLRQPAILFCIGWSIVMLSFTVSIPPVWDTFIHSWRIEIAASIFLLTMLLIGYHSRRDRVFLLDIPRQEMFFVVLPISAFILWSGASVVWSPSWKSAVHHTLVWSEYLIFYLTVRHFLSQERNYTILVRTLALTLAFFAILAIFAYCSFLIFGGTSIGIVYSKYGEQINTIFPLLLVGVLRSNGRRFIWGTVLLVILWMLIFSSLSRTNLFLFMAGLLATAAVVICFRRFQRYRLKFAIAGLAIVVSPFPFHIFTFLSADPGVPIVNRLADEAGISSSNNFRRLMIATSMTMISAHPLVGVGADNFGFEFNKYRAEYASSNPNDLTLAESESNIAERAHNEYVQITAELGIVGAAIFLWLLAGIAFMAYRALGRLRTISLYPLAALLGIWIFLLSSLVTSYSFRLIQNGFVFFFVLAVAAKLLFTDRKPPEKQSSSFVLSKGRLQASYAVGILACLLLATWCVVRVGSAAYATKADHTRNLEEAMPLYQAAMQLDDENPEARYSLGLRLVEQGRYSEAIPYLEESIRIGKARSADFSFLATAQSLGGNHLGAEQTFAAAVALYPRSPFALTRYAALLQNNGKAEEAAIHLERAITIDPRQARTWWTLITVSPQAAADLAIASDNYVALMDLKPQESMYAVKAEREIRHPEEKFNFGTLLNLAKAP